MYTFSEPIGYIFCITLVIDAEHLQIGTAVELGYPDHDVRISSDTRDSPVCVVTSLQQ